MAHLIEARPSPSVRRAVAIGAALSVFLALAVVAPNVAFADHTTCDTGEFCVWADPNNPLPDDDFWGADQSDPNWPCGGACHPNVDNNEDSLHNKTGVIIDVFDADSYGGGVKYCAPVAELENDIASDRDDDGNSSKKRTTSCPSSMWP